MGRIIHKDILQVHLSNETVAIYGTPEDSVGSVVSGTVLFTPSKSVKIRYISLKLEGVLSMENFQELYGAYKVLTQSSLLLLGPSIGYHHFEGGRQYRFDFELPLKGNVPETVKVSYGRIMYQISVTVVRPFPYLNIKRHQSFRVERICLPTEISEVRNHSTGIWDKYVYYHISVPSGKATIGSTLPISVKYVFKFPAIKVDKIRIRLLEFISYRHPVSMVETAERKQLAHHTNHFEELSNYGEFCINKQIKIQIPTVSECDYETKFITITHKLSIKTRLIDSKNRKWSTMLELPVSLQSPIQSELSCSPPSYSDLTEESPCVPPPPAYVVLCT
ncbi:hypothetical protein K7432_003385 [Basidiobolus ranarum]|uniref:Arrestin C-terminal-like domain-containing protein n=1 Tax=Basidiobolus ranarum TaxID=34480 RepID=A0ABR2WZW7_9FUNG